MYDILTYVYICIFCFIFTKRKAMSVSLMRNENLIYKRPISFIRCFVMQKYYLEWTYKMLKVVRLNVWAISLMFGIS